MRSACAARRLTLPSSGRVSAGFARCHTPLMSNVRAMLLNRVVVWPVIALSYGSVAMALLHSVGGNWSGAASLGLFFSVLIGVPTLAGYAGHLWRKNLLHGLARYEALVCAAFPVVLLLLVGFVLIANRLQWL